MRPSEVAMAANPPQAFGQITQGDDVQVQLQVMNVDGSRLINYQASWVLYADADDDVVVGDGVADGGLLVIGQAVTGQLLGSYIFRLALLTDSGVQHENYLITIRR